jgi:hypothetical protein
MPDPKAPVVRFLIQEEHGWRLNSTIRVSGVPRGPVWSASLNQALGLSSGDDLGKALFSARAAKTVVRVEINGKLQGEPHHHDRTPSVGASCVCQNTKFPHRADCRDGLNSSGHQGRGEFWHCCQHDRVCERAPTPDGGPFVPKGMRP